MAAMDDDMVVKAGPFDLPNDGQNGTLTWADRQEILGLTGVSAAVRDRKNTHGKRHLTLSGPMSGMDLAKKMAWQYIVNSQRKQADFEETPGAEKDWVATERSQKRKPAASSNSSSSWQAMPMHPMQAMMEPMHVMPGMPGMMQHPMMQAYMQPMMHGMLQQHQQAMMQAMHQRPPMMQPMYVRQGGRSEVEHSEVELSDADDDEDAEVPAAKLAPPPLASPAAKPPSKRVLAATSKTPGPAPPTYPPPAKAAPRGVNHAGSGRAAPPGQKTSAAKDAGDQHPANQPDSDVDADDDGPAHNATALASRRTVEEANKKRKLVSIRQDPTIQYVNIMSVGWRQQGVQYTHDFNDLVEGKQGLIYRLKVRGLPEPDVVVDCRPLKRWDFDRAILKHTGHHAAIVHQTVSHRLFKPTLQGAMDNIRDLFTEGRGANVLVVCTSGCHRSVSFALVMEYILNQMLYHTKVMHLSDGSWRTRRMCMSCPECDDDNKAKKESFEAAAQMMLE
jgi:hypothetical protein